VDDNFKSLLDQYPFLSYLTYGGNDYVGVIQNSDDSIITIYDYSAVRTLEEKQRYLELGEQWWWESNRKIPINLFLKQDWADFRYCLRVLNSKTVDIKYGPTGSMAELQEKKSKRKSITLVRRNT
jgi:hypothetical protein